MDSNLAMMDNTLGQILTTLFELQLNNQKLAAENAQLKQAETQRLADEAKAHLKVVEDVDGTAVDQP